MWVSKDRLRGIEKSLEKLEKEIRYCSECGVAYKRRLETLAPYFIDFPFVALGATTKEATNCTWCDEAVKEKKEKEAKVKEAIKVAESCPEAVLGIKDKKACKSE